MIDAEYAELLRQYLAAPTLQLRELLHARYQALALGDATGSGLPFPDPADPVAAGADAIRALAEALDPATATTWNAPHLSDAPATGRTYFSTGRATNTQEETYLAMSPSSDSTSSDAVWMRWDSKSYFRMLRDGHLILSHAPYAMAAGQFQTGTISANEYADTTVTFPSGRFTAPPRVTFGSGAVRGAVSHQNTVTTSGMTVRVFNGTTGGSVSSGTWIYWTATQMTEGSGSG